MLPALPATFTTPPILMYHRVDAERPSDAVGRDLTIDPRQFEAQLQMLRARGIDAISMSEMNRRLRLHLPMGRTVVLTFDDGYEDQYSVALPLLRRYHANATFYIVSGQVGRPRHVTWAQLRSMNADGFDIAAHGVQHDDLSQMTPGEQRYQIRTSVGKLRAFVHAAVDSYAYPSGRFNAQTMSIVRQAGLSLAVTTDPVYVLPPETRFELTRVRVRSEWGTAAFWSALEEAWRVPQTVRSGPGV